MGRGLAQAAAKFRPIVPELDRMPVQGTPREAAKAVAAAIRLRNAGKLAESLAHLRHAAELDPGNARIHLDLGTSLLGLGRAEEALPPLFRAIEVDPKLARAHYHLGLALEGVGREPEAMVAFERTLALRPRNAEALHRLGVLVQEWRSPETAAPIFRAAADCAGPRAEKLRFTARVLRIEGDLAAAEDALRRAAALKPDDAGLPELRAGILVEQGRFGEAEPIYRGLLATDATLAGSAIGLFGIARAGEADRPLLQRLARAVEQTDVPPQGRILLHFALGRAHEQLGDYERAMRHFDAGNAIRGGIAPLDRGDLQARADRLRAEFPLGGERGSPASPDAAEERAVFILGLPRSGTTLVEQIISSHPAVAAGGELPFWPQRAPALLAASDDAAFAAAGAAYRGTLARISDRATRVTDKNPFNFFWIGALRRALPGARIVHVRRSLIDTALSNYTTFLSSRRNFFMGRREDLLFWIDTYRELMQHWRAGARGDRFLEVDYERLVANREVETRRLIAFCGLEWDAACLYPERNERAVFTASVWQARQPVYQGSVGRWRRYAPWLGALERLVAEEA